MRIGIDVRTIFAPKTGDRSYTINLVSSLARLDQENEYFLLTRTPITNRHQSPLTNHRLPVTRHPSSVTRHPSSITRHPSSVTHRLMELPLNFHLICLHAPTGWYFTQVALPLFAKQARLSLLHVQYITPLLCPCPVVTTIHDVSWERIPWAFPVKDRWLLSIFIPISLRVASRIITDSQASKADLIKFYRVPAEKVEVIYLAAEERFFNQPTISDSQPVWEQLGLNPPYLLCLGVLQPRKNIHRIIQALGKLKEGGNLQLPLVIVGKRGWGYFRLERLVEEHGLKLGRDVVFTGYLPDDWLPAVYRGAEAFIYPSLWEGFGLPVLEAMAFGVPVVTSDCGALREIAEGAAVLVNPYDADGLAEAIQKVMEDAELRERLKFQGQQRARHFNWLDTARKTLQVYVEVSD